MDFDSTNAWKDAVLDRMKFTNIPDADQAPAHDTVLFVGEQIVLNTLRRKYAGFPQKYSPLRNNLVVVQRTASMGLGVFAKRQFKVGDTVVRKRPFLIAAVDIQNDPSLVGKEYNPVIGSSALGEMLESAERRFLPSNRTGFADLSTDYSLNSMPDIMKSIFQSLYVLSCNSFRLSEQDFAVCGVYKDYDYRVVPRAASRINHSCAPNVVYHFDEATFTFNMVATRDIKAGEEILTMYCGLQVPKAERHRKLLPYGIDPCRCQACETTYQIGSDRRRKSICSFDMIGVKNLPPRDALKELARLVKLIEKEKLHYLDIYPIALHWIAHFWGKLNQKTISQKKLKEAEIYFDIQGKAHSKWLQNQIAIAE
ncbi:hypothetical protein EV359DRAFT_78958 [Lentinula novae-zelandiae]|nr:hypothetical protein EV359DRAFT_78958 [Lentinula novae-zelandiae]